MKIESLLSESKAIDVENFITDLLDVEIGNWDDKIYFDVISKSNKIVVSLDSLETKYDREVEKIRAKILKKFKDIEII